MAAQSRALIFRPLNVWHSGVKRCVREYERRGRAAARSRLLAAIEFYHQLMVVVTEFDHHFMVIPAATTR